MVFIGVGTLDFFAYRGPLPSFLCKLQALNPQSAGSIITLIAVGVGIEGIVCYLKLRIPSKPPVEGNRPQEPTEQDL